MMEAAGDLGATPTAPPELYEFGPYRLDVPARRLLRNGEPVAVTPKAFDTLLALVERRDRVVDKAELMRLIWPDSFVEEANLSQTIFVLRKTLGEDAHGRQFIDTVPRRGYRFAAEVTVTPDAVRPESTTASTKGVPQPVDVSRRDNRRPGRWFAAAGVLLALLGAAVVAWRSAAREMPIRSLAVLPLANLSGEPDQDYLAHGLTEALISDLAQIQALRVVARSSTLAYGKRPKPARDVGRELGVDGIIEGSVIRSGDRVRVSIQLVHAASERNVWARSYDRRFADVLDLQGEIARSVAGEVSAVLTPSERRRLQRAPVVDPRAHDAYLRGRFDFNQRTREGFLSAIRHFETAAAQDPRFAAAYSGLADCHTLLAGFLHAPAREAIPRAAASAERALQLDPELADAHVSLGYIRLRYDYDWPRAEEAFRRAIALNPNSELAHHWYALSLAWAGRLVEARAEMDRAVLIDPLSLATLTSSGWLHYFAREYDRALAVFDRALSIDASHVIALRRRGWAYQMLGRHDEAIASFERARALSGGDFIETAALGRGYAMAGRRDEALALVRELQERDPPGDLTAYSIGEIYAAMGDVPQALRWLDRAHVTRSIWYVFLKSEPVFDRLRPDSQFQELVDRVRW